MNAEHQVSTYVHHAGIDPRQLLGDAAERGVQGIILEVRAKICDPSAPGLASLAIARHTLMTSCVAGIRCGKPARYINRLFRLEIFEQFVNRLYAEQARLRRQGPAH